MNARDAAGMLERMKVCPGDGGTESCIQDSNCRGVPRGRWGKKGTLNPPLRIPSATRFVSVTYLSP